MIIEFKCDRFFFLIFCLMIILFSSSSFAKEIPSFISDKFCDVMIKNLLDLKKNDTSQNGAFHYREWNQEIYEILNKSRINREEMKAYLLILFITEVRGKVATGEHFTEIIIKTIEQNTDIFFVTLNELPFFIPVVCSRINRHFRSFAENENKAKFIRKYEKIISSKLGRRKGADFIKMIQEDQILLSY